MRKVHMWTGEYWLIEPGGPRYLRIVCHSNWFEMEDREGWSPAWKNVTCLRCLAKRKAKRPARKRA